MTRKEAIEHLRNMAEHSYPNEEYLMAIEALELVTSYEGTINKLTEALNQQKEGHWRPIYQGDEIIDYRCSKCEFGCTIGKSTHGMNYCPNCGAKMVEPQDSEEENG